MTAALCRESARIAVLVAADGPDTASPLCRCAAPAPERFYGFEQCARCGKPLTLEAVA